MFIKVIMNFVNITMKKEKNKFYNADEAFDYYYKALHKQGHAFGDTRCLFNVGFEITNPLQNKIHTSYRSWSYKYAKREWAWYLSGDPNAEEIAKHAPIWYKMMDGDGNVRSNYGWQWERNHQLDKVVAILSNNKESRQASISIYDGKEMSTYRNDTPCTYAIHFYIHNKRLNMSVVMRSNDIWYGFCNDQYCFSKLLELVADRLEIKIGNYYHFVNNLHVYLDFMNKHTVSIK